MSDIRAILDTASRRAVLQTRLDTAKARFRERTRYAFNGGTFQITPSLMAEIHYRWMVNNTDRAMIVIDLYDMPIEVKDVESLLDTMGKIYESCIRGFYLDVKAAREESPVDLFDV